MCATQKADRQGNGTSGHDDDSSSDMDSDDFPRTSPDSRFSGSAFFGSSFMWTNHLHGPSLNPHANLIPATQAQLCSLKEPIHR